MNSNFDWLTRLAWAQLWQVTIVALGIAAIVRLSCHDRPRVAYALWMLVVIKAIVPPCWSSPTGIFSWALAASARVQPVFAEEPLAKAIALPANPPFRGGTASARGGSENAASHDRASFWERLQLAVISVWVAGFALCAAYVVAKQIACSTVIRRSSLPVDESYLSMLADLSRRLSVKRIVRLFVTSRPIGPAAFGLIRPSILLPEALLRGNSLEQVGLVVAHELVHVRRGDIVAGKLQLVAQLIWWFHPLIWWANQEASRERERCCDGEVLSGVGCKPAKYARALLSVLEQKSRFRSLVAIPGVRAIEVTSRRLEFIMRDAKTDHRRASTFARVVFVVGAVMVVPGMGLTLRAQPSMTDEVDKPVPAAPAKSTPAPDMPKASRSDDKPIEGQTAKERLRTQQIDTRKARAGYQRAGLAREIAEIAVLEYEEGIFKQDLATVEGEIKLADSDRQRAKDRLDWARRMFAKGFVSKATVVSEELNFKKARFAIEQAQSKKKVLVDYTRGKTVKELKAEVEKARSDEMMKKNAWEQEKAKESALEREVTQSRPPR